MNQKYMSPWIFTTNQCNLRCPYCYVHQNEEIMPGNIYKRINETFIKMLNNGLLDFVVYRMAGGEPFLVFDNWKDHIEHFIQESGENGFVSILTNLTILTDEMLQFLEKHKDRIGFGISLDGFNYSKPFPNGESSAEIVKANIDKLIDIGIKNIEISTVIDKESFSDIKVLSNWVAKRNLGWGVNLDHFFCGEIEYETICNKMKEVIDVLSKSDFNIYSKLRFCNIKLDANYDGCTAGEKLIAIDLDGSVYPCQTLVGESPICNIMECENLIESLKKQTLYNVGYQYKAQEKCKKCSLEKLCGGGCKLHNQDKNKEYTCDIIKSVILYMTNAVLNMKGEF